MGCLTLIGLWIVLTAFVQSGLSPVVAVIGLVGLLLVAILEVLDQ